jgi:chromosome segregation ATPase
LCAIFLSSFIIRTFHRTATKLTPTSSYW